MLTFQLPFLSSLYSHTLSYDILLQLALNHWFQKRLSKHQVRSKEDSFPQMAKMREPKWPKIALKTDPFLYLRFCPASFSVPVVNVTTGESVETVDLKPSIFGVPVRTDLLHQLVVWHLANKRKGLASVRAVLFYHLSC